MGRGIDWLWWLLAAMLLLAGSPGLYLWLRGRLRQRKQPPAERHKRTPKRRG